MKQSLLGLSISVAFILGCVTATAVTSQAHADAAPTSSGGECIAVVLDFVEARDLHAGRMPTRVRVPPGWHPVGGGGASTGPTVVLCRRHLGTVSDRSATRHRPRWRTSIDTSRAAFCHRATSSERACIA